MHCAVSAGLIRDGSAGCVSQLEPWTVVSKVKGSNPYQVSINLDMISEGQNQSQSQNSPVFVFAVVYKHLHYVQVI